MQFVTPQCEDITGRRFGQLTVLGYLGKKKWLVQCDCGSEPKSVRRANFRVTKSCGCWKALGKYQKDTTGVAYGVSARNFVLKHEYKRGARDRNLTWNISEEDFDRLTAADCTYCGAKPSNCRPNKFGKGDFIYSGIDRVDNTRGYEPDNVVSCCRVCNRAKDVMSREGFLAWITRVARKNNL